MSDMSDMYDDMSEDQIDSSYLPLCTGLSGVNSDQKVFKSRREATLEICTITVYIQVLLSPAHTKTVFRSSYSGT